MAEDDGVIRRAHEHLAQHQEPAELPDLRPVTFADVGHEIDCDLGCDYAAVAEGYDGWMTPVIEGGRETIPSYTICGSCKDLWERGDWERLVDEAAHGAIAHDLAYLSNDTARADAAFDAWDRHYNKPDNQGHDPSPTGTIPGTAEANHLNRRQCDELCRDSPHSTRSS